MGSSRGQDIIKKVVKDCKIMIEDKKGFTVKELESLADSLQKDIKEDMFKDITENEKYQALYNSANEFYNNIIKLSQTSTQSLNAFSKNENNGIGSMTSGYEVRTIRLRLAYLSAFKFAEYVHQYLGQPLSKALVVIDGDDGKPYTVEISLIELVKAAGSAGHIHQEWVKDIIGVSETKTVEELSKEAAFKEQDDHLKKLRKAYSFVQNNMRYVEQTRTKIKDGKEVEVTGGQYYIKLYNNNNDWRTYNIINQGDLKEAYAAALMRQHQDNITGLEEKVDYICLPDIQGDTSDRYKEDRILASEFFHNYIALVDNKGALLGEDIMLEGVQYAVKAAGATMPKLGQYIRAAQAILASKDNLEEGIKEYFDKEKIKKVALRNKLVETEIKAVTDALESTWNYNT